MPNSYPTQTAITATQATTTDSQLSEMLQPTLTNLSYTIANLDRLNSVTQAINQIVIGKLDNNTGNIVENLVQISDKLTSDIIHDIDDELGSLANLDRLIIEQAEQAEQSESEAKHEIRILGNFDDVISEQCTPATDYDFNYDVEDLTVSKNMLSHTIDLLDVITSKKIKFKKIKSMLKMAQFYIENVQSFIASTTESLIKHNVTTTKQIQKLGEVYAIIHKVQQSLNIVNQSSNKYKSSKLQGLKLLQGDIKKAIPMLNYLILTIGIEQVANDDDYQTAPTDDDDL